jgi:pimeloyl-ACP methyl ester carboxylesterase
MALIVFSHANSFPAGTYGVLFRSLRARGHTVKAIEKFGHDPKFPVTSNWPHIAKELAQFAAAEVQKAGEPAYLIGHSLGGFLSLMTSCKHPELSRGVVLLHFGRLAGKDLAVCEGNAARRISLPWQDQQK